MKMNALQIADVYKYFSREFKSRWRYILKKQRIDMEKEITGLKDQIYCLNMLTDDLKRENQDLKLVMGMMVSDTDAELFVNGQQIQIIPSKRFPNTPVFRNQMFSLSRQRIEQAKAEGLI